jgi:hypothetical protein
MYENEIAFAVDRRADDRPYLAHLGELADEAALVASYIQDFIARCRGSQAGEAKTGPMPVPSGHLGNLERLTENMARLDKLARELQSIG